MSNDRDDTILILRRELRARTGRAWSVTGGRGSAWGWITVTAPPARRVDGYHLSAADQAELSRVFGEPVGHQGVQIPASTDHRIEYVDRVRGMATRPAAPYWD